MNKGWTLSRPDSVKKLWEWFMNALAQQEAWQIVKAACDRDWAEETPLQIAYIVSNAMFWRNDEIRRLRAELATLQATVTRLEAKLEVSERDFTNLLGAHKKELEKTVRLSAHVSDEELTKYISHPYAHRHLSGKNIDALLESRTTQEPDSEVLNER